MADLIYFLSQSIEVYPSGFRGQGYPQSKLTTEENITRLQSYSDLTDGIYDDDRDADYYILKISGYTFKFSKQSLIKALPQTPNPSENIYRVFAGIKLRDGGTNIGSVLAPLNSTLSSDIILDKDDHFQGLGLEITTNSEPTPNQFDFYTEIGLWVKSAIQPITGDIPEGVTPEIITGYAFAANGNSDDYIGTPLRYKVEQTSPLESPFNISILGVVAASDDGTFTELNIPKKVIFNSMAGSGDNLKFIPHTFTVNQIQTIQPSAFEDCIDLTSITIPENITSIGKSAFSGCSMLTKIYYNAIDCNASEGIFPSAREDNGGITVTIGANVKKIPNGLFWSQPEVKITSVVFEKGSVCESIGNSAFRECNYLTNIALPDGMTSIGNWSFDYCTSLTNIIIPNSVTSIGQGAFSDCPIENAIIPISAISAIEKSSLKTVALTSGESIPDHEFRGCRNLTNIIIPESVTSIGMYAFEGCDSLTSVTIGSSVRRIGEGTFSSCSSLTSITIPSRVTRIDGYAFQGCHNLTNIIIPNSVTSIGTMAFYNCKSLTNIVLPNNLERIGDYAFMLSDTDSSTISQIIIPEKVTEIGSNAFMGRSKITKIIVHNYMNSITGAPWGASNAKVLWLMMNDDLKLYVPETVLDEGSYEIYYRYINTYMSGIQEVYLGKLDIFPENFKINNRPIFGRVLKSVLEPKDATTKVTLSTYLCGVPDGDSLGRLHLWNLDNTLSEVTLASTSDNFPQIWYKRIY